MRRGWEDNYFILFLWSQMCLMGKWEKRYQTKLFHLFQISLYHDHLLLFYTIYNTFKTKRDEKKRWEWNNEMKY